MQLSEYVQDRESILCEASVTNEKSLEIDSNGDLACTDSRLLFADGTTITDIRLASIDEIEVRPPTYLNRFAAWAGLFALVAVVAFVLLPAIPPVQDLAVPVTALLLLLAIVEGGLAVYYAKWTVEVKTSLSNHRFISNDASLQDIPQAIRGAEQTQ